MKFEINNRKAYFNYNIEFKYSAGISLHGTEVKSIRDGSMNFNDSYCYFVNNELYVKNIFISEFKNGSYNHEPVRDRKLLLKKRELRKIEIILKKKGYAIVPLRFFLNERNLIKLEIGVGRGKKEYDKRESIKKRDADREIKKSF